MDSLDKLLLSLCDANMTINMTEHWRTFYLAGFNKDSVDTRASAIGINLMHPPARCTIKIEGTIIGMMPVRCHTILGFPAVSIV